MKKLKLKRIIRDVLLGSTILLNGGAIVRLITNRMDLSTMTTISLINAMLIGASYVLSVCIRKQSLNLYNEKNKEVNKISNYKLHQHA